ncbi:MAG: hypothetical protein QGF09_04225 [Rhodospirillales bacterium]|jgi:hypothetical protein|nr:hypothetical protein [Rhodospirillales bacterium]
MALEDPANQNTAARAQLLQSGGAEGCSDDETPQSAGSYAGCALPKNHLLTDEGWEWRGNADERRAREMTDTYEELGFEVKIEPLDLNQLSEGCFGCKDVLNDFGAVYVRKKN